MLFANVLSGGEAPADINDLANDAIVTTARLRFDDFALIDSALLSLEEIERLRSVFHDDEARTVTTTRFMKCHDGYARLPDGRPLLGEVARPAIYIVRDPRDVAVALSFFAGVSFNRAVEIVCSGCTLSGSSRHLPIRLADWSTHVSSWMDQADVPVCVVRYEDMKTDAAGAFAGVLAFLGSDPDAGMVARAVRHSSFDELRAQEQRHGFIERGRAEGLFFRRGTVGDWRNHLSDAQVARIEAVHGATMARLHYEPVTGGECSCGGR